MQLTSHFKLSEFTYSRTAQAYGLVNAISDQEIIDNIMELCVKVLQPLRAQVGVIKITSGYRSKPLNQLVKGSINSAHMRGLAVDFFVPAANPSVVIKHLTANPAVKELVVIHTRGQIPCYHVAINADKQFYFSVKSDGKYLF